MKYYGIQNEVKAYINRLNRDNISVTTDDLKMVNDRVILLKKSGVWSKFSLGFNDIDADAYCVRAGVTNLLGRCEVIWFAKGVKSLGLWNSMVSWPMRNYQNVGTSSTIYSLGGLGIFNGTSVNSPTWGSDGVNFSSTNQLVSFAANIPASIYTLLTIISPSNTITSASPAMSPIGVKLFGGILLGSSTGGLTNELITRYVGEGDTSPTMVKAGGYTGAGSILANTFNYISTSIANSGILSINWNGNSLAVTNSTGWIPNTSAAYTLGDRPFNDASFLGNMAFSALLNVEGDSNQQVLFYNLYKNTIGNNLGLP
jgi:hypothetical protein